MQKQFVFVEYAKPPFNFGNFWNWPVQWVDLSFVARSLQCAAIVWHRNDLKAEHMAVRNVVNYHVNGSEAGCHCVGLYF